MQDPTPLNHTSIFSRVNMTKQLLIVESQPQELVEFSQVLSLGVCMSVQHNYT